MINKLSPNCSFSRELGIGIVAFGPLGSGFLASGPKLVENLNTTPDFDARKVGPNELFISVRSILPALDPRRIDPIQLG